MRHSALLIVLATACIPQKPAARVSHDAGALVSSANEARWVELSDEEMRTIVPGAEPAPESVALPIRDDVKAMDEAARKRHPQAFAAIPVPKVFLTRSTEQNAFSYAVEVCLPLTVEWAGGSSAEGALRVDEAGLLSRRVKPCLTRPATGAFSPEQVAARIAKAQRTSPQASCQSHWNGETLRFEGGCGAGAQPPRTSQNLTLPVVSNVLVVHEGIVSLFGNRDALRFLLAHELAHFYRAHAVAAPGEYGYFYRHSEHSFGTTPSRDARAQAIGEESQRLHTLKPFPAVAGSRWHTYAFANHVPYGEVGKFVKALCAQPNDCPAGCQQPPDTATSEALRSLARGQTPKPEHAAAYLRYEADFRVCAKGISIVSAPSDQSAALFTALGKDINLRFPHLASEIASWRTSDTLESYMDDMSKSAFAIESRKREIEERMRQDWIGFYTTEQNADDVALELLTLAGFRVQGAIEAQAFLLEREANTSLPRPGETPPAECLRLYKSGWMEAGNPVHIPIGTTVSTRYHSECYRLHNLDREVRAHGY